MGLPHKGFARNRRAVTAHSADSRFQPHVSSLFLIAPAPRSSLISPYLEVFMRRFICVLILFSAVGLSAETAPRKVKIGAYLANINKLDLALGRYTADIEITMELPPGSEAPRIEIMNGTFEPGKFKELPRDAAHPNIRQFKASAEIDIDSDFRRFPWDEQDLSVFLVSEEESVESLVFETSNAYESQISEKARVAGWNLDHSAPQILTESISDPKEKHSIYHFPLEIHRSHVTSFLKVFFPLLIMLIISMLALFISAAGAANRLTIVTGALLAAAMFQLNATSSVPAIGYVTFADLVFIMTYISFLLNIITTIVLWRRNEAKNEEGVKSLFKKALRFVPAVSAGLYLVPVIYFILAG